tara:strand:- start:76 stop:339 length:264 start_codon:yes stop_codon:yes gene_type:complete
MKMHSTLIDKLLKIYEINSGWKEEWKLKKVLNTVDISVYTNQQGVQILVPAEELNKHVVQAQRTLDQERQLRMETLIADAKRANGEN